MTHSPSPSWRRPRGVADGTWEYVNQRSIAVHYDDFVADTPLCSLDAEVVGQILGAAQKKSSHGVVIDFGCGTGRMAELILALGYGYLGVDLSLSMLEQVQAKLLSMPSGDRLVGTLQANLVELDCIADHVADHALCLFSTLGMIQGRENRRCFLKHACRVVKPGGTMTLHVHNRWSAITEPGGSWRLLRSMGRSLRDKDQEFGDDTYGYRGLQNMFLHRFSARELRRDCYESGWKLDTIRRVSLDGKSIVSRSKLAGGFIANLRVPGPV